MFILMLFIKVILGLFIIALILVCITPIFLLMTVGKADKAATQSSSGSHQDDDEPEMVNHPDHYNRPGQKECIVEMEEKFGLAAVQYFCLLSRYKYLYRCGMKDDATQDISKANWYCDKFRALDGDDELLNIVPDNIKEAMRYES